MLVVAGGEDDSPLLGWVPEICEGQGLEMYRTGRIWFIGWERQTKESSERVLASLTTQRGGPAVGGGSSWPSQGFRCVALLVTRRGGQDREGRREGGEGGAGATGREGQGSSSAGAAGLLGEKGIPCSQKRA